MAKVDPAAARRVYRALINVEDLHERNKLVQGAVKAAAEGNEEIALMATVLSDYVKMMGRTSALELLAALGWWLIENESADGYH